MKLLAVVSIPLVDLRPFVETNTFRLLKPTFPTPTHGEQFVRGTGVVNDRRRGGTTELSGEDTFCTADSCIRILPSHGRKITLEDGSLVQIAFRRLYHTGHAALRFDVGLVIRSDSIALDATEMARQLGRINVRILTTGSGKPESCKLQECASILAQHYLRATTSLSKGELPKISGWWCKPAAGMVFLEQSSFDGSLKIGADSTIANLDKSGILLSHGKLDGCGSLRSLWVLRRDDMSSDLRHVRQVRIYTTRLNSEFCVFRTVVNALRTEPMQSEATLNLERTRNYLDRAISLVSRSERFGVPQRTMLESTLGVLDSTQPGAFASLLESAKELRTEMAIRTETNAKEQTAGEPSSHEPITHTVAPWEKVVTYAAAGLILMTVLYLVIRNEPFRDPNLVVVTRGLMSVFAAALGVTFPGFLNLSWHGKGLAIRAGGALGLLTLTYLATPAVLPHS